MARYQGSVAVFRASMPLGVFAQEPQLAADLANEIARIYSSDRIALATAEQREGLAHSLLSVGGGDADKAAGRDALVVFHGARLGGGGRSEPPRV